MKEEKKAESGSKKNSKTKEGFSPEDTNQKLQSECLNYEDILVKKKKQKKAKMTAEGLVTPNNNKEAMPVSADGETVTKSKKSSRFDNGVTKFSNASDGANEVNVKEPGKKKLKKKDAKANVDFEDAKAEEVPSKKPRKKKRENSAPEAPDGNTSAPAKSELQGSESIDGDKYSEQHDLPKKKKKDAKKSVEDTPRELVTLHPAKSDKEKDGSRTVDAEENAKRKKQKREVSAKENCNDSMVTLGEPAPDSLAGVSEGKQVDNTADPMTMGEKKQKKNAVCGKKRKVVEEEKHSSASMVQEALQFCEKEDIDKPTVNDRVHKKKKQKDVEKIMELLETQNVQLECQSIDRIQEKKKKDKKQKNSIEGLSTDTLDENKDEAGAEKHKKKGKHSKKNADNGLHVSEVSNEQHEASKKELTSNGAPKGKKRKEKYMDSIPDSSQPNCPDPTAHGKDIETKELPSKKSRKESGKYMNAKEEVKTILEPAAELEEAHMNTSAVEVNRENTVSEQDALPKRKKKHANKGVESLPADLGPKEGEIQIFSGQSGTKVTDAEPSAKKKKLKKGVPQENVSDLRFTSGELVANTEGKQADARASYPALGNGLAEKKEKKNACGKNQKVAEDGKHILGNTVSTSCNGTAKELPRIESLEQGDKEDVDQAGKEKLKDGKQKTPTGALAFKRVDVDKVDFFHPRLKDNSYWAKDGADEGYGAKAQEVLGQVRGRDFRHEKTKKKRGSYRGGMIDLQSHSIKFSNSDED